MQKTGPCFDKLKNNVAIDLMLKAKDLMME
jgi:hypothetical protein